MKMIPFLSLLLLLVSCDKKLPFEKHFAEMTGDEAHSLRSASLGDPYMTVMENEKAGTPEFQDTNMIRYTIHKTDSEEYKIAYYFEEDRLKEIRYDAFLGAISNGEKLVSMFRKRFDAKYGPGSEQQGVLTWGTENEAAELTDESELYGYGKVSLLIFRPTSRIIENQPL